MNARDLHREWRENLTLARNCIAHAQASAVAPKWLTLAREALERCRYWRAMYRKRLPK